MHALLFTPESVRTASLAILNAALALHLVRIRQRAPPTSWMAAFAGAMALFYSMRFVRASVYPIDALGGWAALRMAVECLALPLALTAWVQFAYSFPDVTRAREARLVGLGSALVVGALALHAAWVLLGGGDVLRLYRLYAPTTIAFGSLAATVFLRQRPRVGAEGPRREERVRARRACTSFAALSALYALTGVVIGSVLGWRLLPGYVWPVVAVPAVFAFYAGVVVAFVNHSREPTTLQVKLIGLSLATVLAVLGIAAGLLYPPGEMLAASRVLPPDDEALSFRPDGTGGYRVRGVPAERSGDPGQRLSLGDSGRAVVPLGFAFPYQGRRWNEVALSEAGLIAFGDLHRASPGEAVPPLDLVGTAPAISPLSRFLPLVNAIDRRRPAVFLDREPGRLRVTWRFFGGVEGWGFADVELQVDDTGQIRFGYSGLQRALMASYLRLGMPRGGVRGLHPGGRHQRPVETALSADSELSLPAGVGLVDDLGRRFRTHVHHSSARLMALLLAATLFTLVAFPRMLRSGVLEPLGRLVGGVRRLDAGERDLELPVGVRDEIGVLTESFNRMARSLRDAEGHLRARAEELERRVSERTAELESRKALLEEQASRLREQDEVKTRFFANVSHELRTPLTLLLGPLDDALDGRPGPTRLEQRAPVMRRNALRLLELINQLLDLSRVDAGGLAIRPRPTDLVAFLRRLVVPFAERAEREGLAVLYDPDAESLQGRIDRDCLEKIVTNLLANAFRYTAPGGKVRLGLTIAPGEQSRSARITVEDTGCGIPASALPRVFDRFQQVGPTPDGGGTGIGLALVKELVELHGGAISVSSRPGFGTTFEVTLPLGAAGLAAAEDQESAEPPEQTSAGAVGVRDVARPATDVTDPGPAEARADSTRATVLIVEDDTDLRSFLRESLAADYQVLEAGDGGRALELARARQPSLVLTDVMLPVMDGLTLCRSLKEDPALSHVPVVVLTARADEESRLQGLGAGADDYLTKPFSSHELKARAENLIEIRRRLRQRFSGEVVLKPSEVVVPSAEAAWVERLRAVVEARLGDVTLSVDSLAREVGVSKRQLQRRLKQTMALSPAGFIRTMRLGRAAQLLSRRAGSVSEIARQVGFSDAEYFSKLFRQVFGRPPSEYADRA